MGQLLPLPELPEFPAATQAPVQLWWALEQPSLTAAIPHSRARWCLSLSTLFLWTEMALFVFKRVPPIRLSLAASSKLHPILVVCMHWMNLG